MVVYLECGDNSRLGDDGEGDEEESEVLPDFPES